MLKHLTLMLKHLTLKKLKVLKNVVSSVCEGEGEGIFFLASHISSIKQSIFQIFNASLHRWPISWLNY